MLVISLIPQPAVRLYVIKIYYQHAFTLIDPDVQAGHPHFM